MAFEADKKHITRRIEEFTKEYNTDLTVKKWAHPDALAFHPGCKRFMQNEEVQGDRKECLDGLMELRNKIPGKMDVHIQEIEVYAPNVAHHVDKFICTTPDGKQTIGRTLIVWKKTDGEWYIYRAMVNSNKPLGPC